MSTKFEAILSSPPSGRAAPLILDHASYGSTRILRGAPVPWSQPVECQSYFGQAQGLLRPDTTLVDIGAAYDQQLASRPELVAAMGARSRIGYALKTLLAEDDLAASAVRLVEVLGETSRQPLVLQVPAHPYRSAHGIDRHAHAPSLQILWRIDAAAMIDAEHPMPEDAGRKYGERNER